MGLVVFAVRTERDKKVIEFMGQTNKRLKGLDLAKNPFSGGANRIEDKNEENTDYYLIDMTPIFPPFYLGGIGGLMLSIVWFKWWLIVPSFIVFGCGIFWSRHFFYVMLRLGLRKAGYKGPIKRIRDNEMLNHLMYKVI